MDSLSICEGCEFKERPKCRACEHGYDGICFRGAGTCPCLNIDVCRRAYEAGKEAK